MPNNDVDMVICVVLLVYTIYTANYEHDRR